MRVLSIALCAPAMVVCAPSGFAQAVADVPSSVVTPAKTIPALTPVVVRFEAALSSQTSVSGERFPMTLAEPIMLDGQVVVPAGAAGEGEVIHADKSSWGGASGELVLAARWLDVNGRRLRLRSLRASGAGRAAVNEALVASVLVTPLVFAVKGQQATFPKGWLAEAKTAEAFALDDVTDSNGSLGSGKSEPTKENTDGK